jgi:CRP-like cAMP-binding protein
MGEVGFLDGLPRSNHVRAKTTCRLGKLTRDGLLNLATEEPLLFAKLVICLAELLASRYRGVVAELEPVRALVASVREGAKDRKAAASVDELETPEQTQALEVLKAVALQAKDLAEL